MFNWKAKAVNAIYLDENVGGKGKYFKSRFLQPGLVKYSFGVCVLDKGTIDKFIQGFVGCPVIINHKDVTEESAKDDRVGAISRVWYDEQDGWYWGEGVIFDDEALNLIDSGYNVSCQYEITEYAENKTKALHNGNEYDKIILNGKPEHLAIVKNPRYENAMIAVNAIDSTEYQAENGFITLDEEDPLTGKRKVIWIPGNVISRTVLDRVKKATENYKEGDETKFDFSHTRVKPTEEQIKYLKDTLKEIEHIYKFKGVAQIEISSELNKGSLGVCFSPENTSLISLSPQLYNGKYSQERYDKGVEKGWNPKGTGDFIKSVLVHELGHAVTCNSKDVKFWDKVDTIRSDYLKNIKKTDIKNPDFISNYARTNKYEFVAEAFCQGSLSKKYGKYTKQVMDLMNEHFGKTSQMKLAFNSKENNNKDDDMWIEGFGYGYPMDEETYEQWKNEQNEEKPKADNSLVENIKQAINEIKESGMFNLFKKKEINMDKDELKALFVECLNEFTASNAKDDEVKEEVKDEVVEEKDDVKEEAENECKEKAEDEKADAEKADAENKCKNEEQPDYKKLYEELKAKVEAKNEEKEEKVEELKEDVDKEVAKNDIDTSAFFNNEVKQTSTYISQAEAIRLGSELY